MSAPTAAAVLEHVVRSIVDQPDAVSVEVTEDGDRTRLDAVSYTHLTLPTIYSV